MYLPDKTDSLLSDPVHSSLTITGVRTLNLKDVSVTFPHRGITVICGPTGVGKTALAIHTIHQAATRRMAAGFGFTGVREVQLEFQAAFDSLSGSRPSISLDEVARELDLRSTVYEFLGLGVLIERLLLAFGKFSCEPCGTVLSLQASLEQHVSELLRRTDENKNLKLLVSAPITGNATEIANEITRLAGDGYRRFVMGDRLVKLSSDSLGTESSRKALESLTTSPQAFLVFESFERSTTTQGDLTEAVRRAFSAMHPVVAVLPVRLRGERRTLPELEMTELIADSPAWFRHKGFICLNCGHFFPNDLRREFLSQLTIDGFNITRLAEFSISDLYAFLKKKQDSAEFQVELRDQVLPYLDALNSLELGTLNLGLTLDQLSSGELLKLLIGNQLHQGFIETMVILEEPGTVLHPIDRKQIAQCLRAIVAAGNTLLLTEQRPQTLRDVDYVIELGDGPGELGGKVRFQGTATDWKKYSKTRSGEHPMRLNPKQALVASNELELRNITVSREMVASLKLPLGGLIAIFGRVGSGKTRLLNTLGEALKARFEKQSSSIEVLGGGTLKQVFFPALERRSGKRMASETLASSILVAPLLGELFAERSTARRAGLPREAFILGHALGRCDACKGRGYVSIDFSYLGKISESCGSCGGKRFKPQVLQVTVLKRSIDEVLRLTVGEALSLFADNRMLASRLQTAFNLGLSSRLLGEFTEELPATISTRVGLAKRVISGRSGRLELLDQAFSDLGAAELELCFATLRRELERQVSFAFSTHDAFSLYLADHAIGLNRNGSVVFAGPVESVARAQALLES